MMITSENLYISERMEEQEGKDGKRKKERGQMDFFIIDALA